MKGLHLQKTLIFTKFRCLAIFIQVFFIFPLFPDILGRGLILPEKIDSHRDQWKWDWMILRQLWIFRIFKSVFSELTMVNQFLILVNIYYYYKVLNIYYFWLKTVSSNCGSNFVVLISIIRILMSFIWKPQWVHFFQNCFNFGPFSGLKICTIAQK